MSEVKEIKQSVNYGKAVGVLSEKKYEIIDGTTKSGAPCKIIRGNIVVTTNDGDMKFGFYQQSTNGKNDGQEDWAAKSYAGLKTAMEQQIAKSDNNGEPDVVAVTFSTRVNDFKSKKGDVISGVNYDVKNISRHKVSADDDMVAEGELSGMITAIVPEIVKEEETGRLKVELVSISYGQKAEPYTLFVGEDLADDFDSTYEVGEVTKLYYTVVSEHYGGTTQQASTGFGRKAKVQSGFDRVEMQIIGGEPSFEEEQEEFFTKEELNPLLENRKIALEKLKSEDGDANKSKGGLKDKKVADIPPSDMPF